MKTINFETLKVGDTVECLLNGKGVVISINNNLALPIKVKFGHTTDFYKIDGKFNNNNITPSLYLEAPKFSEYPKEMNVFGNIKTIIAFYDGYYYDPFNTRYSHASDIQPKRQLTKEQFKEEFGVEFDNIEII